MNARGLKHMARLEEWKGKVAECRSSGKSVRAWCQEQGISCKTYYYWEKGVLSEAERQMGALESVGGSSFVKMPALPEMADTTGTTPALTAKLRIKGGELEVYSGADEKILEALVRVLSHAE